MLRDIREGADVVATLELTRDQIVSAMEVMAARRGMTARTIVRAARDGELDDPGSVADVLLMADLLDPDDALLRP